MNETMFDNKKQTIKFKGYLFLPKYKDLNTDESTLQYFAARQPGRLQLFDINNNRNGESIAFENFGSMLNSLVNDYQARFRSILKLYKYLKKSNITISEKDFDALLVIDNFSSNNNYKLKPRHIVEIFKCLPKQNAYKLINDLFKAEYGENDYKKIIKPLVDDFKNSSYSSAMDKESIERLRIINSLEPSKPFTQEWIDMLLSFSQSDYELWLKNHLENMRHDDWSKWKKWIDEHLPNFD